MRSAHSRSAGGENKGQSSSMMGEYPETTRSAHSQSAGGENKGQNSPMTGENPIMRGARNSQQGPVTMLSLAFGGEIKWCA